MAGSRAGIAGVIGGSMSGLLRALMLRRAGWTWRRRYKRKRMSKARSAYEAARLRENYRIIERARHLGAYLQATRTRDEQARAGLHSTDGAVIAETAVLDFLQA